MTNDIEHLFRCLCADYLLLGSVHMICQVFIWLFGFIVSNYEFFVYVRYKSFIQYMFWKYFLQVCGLPFHFLRSVFWRVTHGQNALSFYLWLGLTCSCFKDFCLYVNEKPSAILSCVFFALFWNQDKADLEETFLFLLFSGTTGVISSLCF